MGGSCFDPLVNFQHSSMSISARIMPYVECVYSLVLCHFALDKNEKGTAGGWKGGECKYCACHRLIWLSIEGAQMNRKNT